MINNPQLTQVKALIQQYIQTDKVQGQLLASLLAVAEGLDHEQKRHCIEEIHKLGGPCNHYFDLTDAIQADE